MTSKPEVEVKKSFTNGQDFYCLPAGISLMQNTQKNNRRQKREAISSIVLDKKQFYFT